MTSFTLTNAQIVLPDRVLNGTVEVRDGKITAIGEGTSQAPDAEDFDGDYLIPGLVELHTDNLEKHVTPRPKVKWPTASALVIHDAQVSAAGITTVLDAVSVGGTIVGDIRDDIVFESSDAIKQMRNDNLLRADHHLHIRCELSNENAIRVYEPFNGDPMVKLVSLMDHTPGQRQFADVSKLRDYYQGKHGMSDEDFDAMCEERRQDQKLYSDKHRQLIVEMATSAGHTLASHDDSTVEHVDEAISFGVKISEFPTTLEAAKAAAENGMKTIGGGPNLVRGGSHSGNIAVGDLAEAGVLHALSSDYVPASLLHGAFTLNDRHGISLPAAIACVSSTPANMIGLEDRGEISEGKRADLIRVRRLSDGTPVVRRTWSEGRAVS